MKLTETQRAIENTETREEMKEEIKRTINSNDVVIFMKGNKLMPQCGYSARALEIVGQYQDDIETVDILRDERIRDILSEITDWPTIPQVFVNGEFLGGSDIIAEMDQEGELKQKIAAVQ